MRTDIAYLPGGLSEAQSHLGYDASCFDSKTSARKAHRKKKRRDSKAAKKSSQKVFPEELFSDVGNDALASSLQCCRDSSENEALSSTDSMKCNCAPPVCPPSSCIHLEKFSQTYINMSTQLADSPSCEISDINCSHSHCLISYGKPIASMNCGLQPLECCNGELDYIHCPSLDNDCSAQANSGSCLNKVIQRAHYNMENVSRKDQSRWTWKRCQKSWKRDTVLLPDHVHLDSSLKTVSSLTQLQAHVPSDEFSVIPCSSAKRNCDASATKEPKANGDFLHRAVRIEVSRESFAHVSEQRIRTELHHSDFHTQPMRSIHSAGSEELLTNRTDFGEIKHNNLRGICGQGSKLYRHQYDSVPSQTDLLQQHFPCEAKLNSGDRGTFDAIQQCEWIKRVKFREDKNSHRYVNENRKNVSYSNSIITSRVMHGQDLPQKPSTRKWIPVCNEKLKIPESTVSDVVYSSVDSLLGKNGSILQGHVIPLSVSDAPSDPQTTKLVSTPEMTSVVEQAPETESSNSIGKHQLVQLIKEYSQPFALPEGFPHLFISAQVAEQAFISSYRLQMASESSLLATGYPLAEFEKLLCSASPLIASSVSAKGCNGCFSNQLYTPSIYREKTQKISLHSIWGWYEEPGNYGLKVNVNGSLSHKEFVADTVQSHAFFVPLLSAVQLFGYHITSSSCGNIKESSLEVDDKKATVKLLHLGNPVSLSGLEASMTENIVDDMMKLRATVEFDETKLLTTAAPSLLSSAELILEYFESEQPQRRMPLHKKIMELARGGTSNAQVFGDPSKLECTNLDDLHPASWFSVAWYPIYRIPEGKLRAAFLTYHSLGHFFQRSTATDSSDKSLNLPVMGLESYNAQGELWFSPKTEVESSLVELTSSVLKERLRILEANAQLFARGMVSRDDKMVANRQPDYEFFMSRKQ